MKYKILIAVFAGCALGFPANIILCNRARSKGISIKYMPVIVFIVIGMPIMAIPFLTDNKTTWLNKLGILLVMLIAGVINYLGTIASRNSIRKLYGLPPVNEDTGEIERIKLDKTDPKSGKWF